MILLTLIAAALATAAALIVAMAHSMSDALQGGLSILVAALFAGWWFR